MNRWIAVLLLCVALYVGIILVRGFTTTVAQPDRQAQQEIRTQQNAVVQQQNTVAQNTTHPKLVVQQMGDSVGNTIVNLGLDFGNSAPTLQKEPTFEIRDANGKRIYQGKFEFG